MSGVPDTGALLLGLAVGLLVGGWVGGAFVSGAHAPDAASPRPGVTYGAAGPSCYDGPAANGGWLHVVANGETWAVTLNATVVHSPETDVTVNVSRRPTGAYEIALRTVDASREKPLSGADCRAATRLDVATGLAEPAFVVTANGRTIRSVDQAETVANLYPLPDPINATR